jgi:hypothetical protein
MVTIGIAFVLIAIGLASPPAVFLSALGLDPDTASASLRLGARLFGLNLVVLGGYLAAIAWTWRPSSRCARPRPGRPAFATVILVVILAVAAILRLHALHTGLWYDEILMYVTYADKSFAEIVTTYDSKNQHFLYTVLAHVASAVFGDGAWALRLPAALFGVASVGALYLVAREVGTVYEALISAALLSVSYQHLWFSQNARGYTGVLFWTLLSTFFLLRAMREERRRWWVLYAIAVSLGVYTHMTMVFVILGQAIVYAAALWTRHRAAWSARWDGALIGFPLAALLTLQLHALPMPQLLAGTMNEASVVPAWRRPFWAVGEVLGGIHIELSSAAIALAALAVFAVGIVHFTRNAPVMASLFVLPVLLCAVAVIGSGHHVWPRFFFFACGFAVLIAVRGARVFGVTLARTARLGPRLTAAAFVLGAVMMIGAAAAAVPRAYAPKQDYTSALAFVQTNRLPEDAVATAGLAAMPYREFFKVDWTKVDSVEALQELRHGARRTWFVYTLPTHLEAVHPDLMLKIRNDFRVVQTFPGTLGGGAIVVCLAEDVAIPRPAGTLNPVSRAGAPKT